MEVGQLEGLIVRHGLSVQIVGMGILCCQQRRPAAAYGILVARRLLLCHLCPIPQAFFVLYLKCNDQRLGIFRTQRLISQPPFLPVNNRESIRNSSSPDSGGS